eukprot:TRINITY_DN231_c0_g1_i2.p1 TRINITY_DN231_c0_g1~~TRINITY_DN231_c0_g1_i2.p1  ORF type:complete len:581 (-),score=125.06 TRINITY_DN231_c0_g1_i2:102-1844(-)
MTRSVAAAALLLALPALSYKYIATCIDGDVIEEGLPWAANDTILGYAAALSDADHNVLGPIASIGEMSGAGPCHDAANAVNLNQALAGHGTIEAFGGTVLTGKTLAKKGKSDKFYFMSFENRIYTAYPYISTCIPGGVVGFNVLNLTKGIIGAYTVVLQAISPTYGELMYLGVSKGFATPCLAAQDRLNAGNETVLKELKKGHVEGVQNINIFGSLQTGNINDTYMFVFTNNWWNVTWGQFTNPAVDEQYADWASANPTPPPKPHLSVMGTLAILADGKKRKALTKTVSSGVGGIGSAIGGLFGGRRRKGHGHNVTNGTESRRRKSLVSSAVGGVSSAVGGIGDLFGGGGKGKGGKGGKGAKSSSDANVTNATDSSRRRRSLVSSAAGGIGDLFGRRRKGKGGKGGKGRKGASSDANVTEGEPEDVNVGDEELLEELNVTAATSTGAPRRRRSSLESSLGNFFGIGGSKGKSGKGKGGKASSDEEEGEEEAVEPEEEDEEEEDDEEEDTPATTASEEEDEDEEEEEDDEEEDTPATTASKGKGSTRRRKSLFGGIGGLLGGSRRRKSEDVTERRLTEVLI